MVATKLTVSQFLSLVELRTKLVSVGTFTVGTLYAVHRTGEFSPLVAAIMFLAVFFVDMATTAFNNFFDFQGGTDVHDYNVEQNKVLLHQGVAPGWALVIALGLSLLAGLLGLWLAVLRGFWLIPVGGACMLVGYFYTGGPRPISTTPVGELFAGGFLGLVLFLLSAAVQTEPGSHLFSWWLLVAALPNFLTIAAILAVNNNCDREGDELAERRTLAVLFGTRFTAGLTYAIVALAHAALFLMAAFGALPTVSALFTLASVAFAVRHFIAMQRRGYHFQTKGPDMIAILKVYGVQTAAYAAGLIIGLAGA
jgi:1,4-dihydroxy-2-naphthoate octaprenyltransferase